MRRIVSQIPTLGNLTIEPENIITGVFSDNEPLAGRWNIIFQLQNGDSVIWSYTEATDWATDCNFLLSNNIVRFALSVMNPGIISLS